MVVISCNSPYGQGGVGQHFAQLVEEARRLDVLNTYYTPRGKPEDSRRRELQSHWASLVSQYTPVRFFPGWETYIRSELFDRKVARALVEPETRFMGFAGECLRSFRKARKLGFRELELVSPTSHVENVWRLHQQALRDSGVGHSWLNRALVRKIRREYEMADRIYVNSEYTRQSFLSAGYEASRLVRTHLSVDPRFTPASDPSAENRFHIAYVGRADVTKGIVLLLEAFSKLSIPDARLTIVGSWSNRSMRHYIQGWMARDPRIELAPGDPLPVLQGADVLVSPSYQDGWGYAPMEALACRVPVIVTEDTGMKECVVEGYNGYVIPTGNEETLVDRLEHLYHNRPLPIQTAGNATSPAPSRAQYCTPSADPKNPQSPPT